MRVESIRNDGMGWERIVDSTYPLHGLIYNAWEINAKPDEWCPADHDRWGGHFQ